MEKLQRWWNLSKLVTNTLVNFGEILKVPERFKKDFGETDPLPVHKNMRGCILEINCEGLGW